MDIKTLTGEQLAEMLNEAYNQLAMAQNNIGVINAELKRRKEAKKDKAESK